MSVNERKKKRAHRLREFSAINPVSTLTFFADVYRRYAINVVIMNKSALLGVNVSVKRRVWPEPQCRCFLFVGHKVIVGILPRT